MTDPGVGSEPIRPIAELFTRSASVLWATTYNVDLRLFNEFLLPRLGAPPLNVTVLADDRCLALGLARVTPDRVDTLAAVNRRWLLRGVRPQGPAFHPKSYLSISGGRAMLLVGSGNLSVNGLDEGREVFTPFRSGTADGDRAIAVWHGWIQRLVRGLDDAVLSRRFDDLETRLPPLARSDGSDARSALLHNLNTPLVTQLVDVVGGRGNVDELLLAAPFYDRDADTVARLVADLRPRRTTVHVAGSTSVNGRALRRRLEGHDLRVRGYEHERYTHAKLVGVIVGESGWLLSGSANLSRVALLRSEPNGGNVELAVVSTLTAQQVRESFVPPGTTVVVRPLEYLDDLVVVDEEDLPELPVRLVRAEGLTDGSVVLVSRPRAETKWLLADGDARYLLVEGPDEQVRTRGPVAGRLVRLVDADGRTLSNPTVVDDTAALAAALGEAPTGPDRDAPAELNAADLDTPLGRALATLHRELVMDVAERADPSPGVTPGGGPVADDEDDDEFWIRVEREHLAGDPRAVRYRQLARSGGSLDLLQQVLGSLGTRASVGSGRQSPLDAFLDRSGGVVLDQEEETPQGADRRRWSATARIRLRVRNVLRRWAAAQSDPRLVWVDRSAPIGNFAVITGVLGTLRLAAASGQAGVELTEADIDEIWWQWLGTFVGTGRRDGFLDRLDAKEAEDAVQGLEPWVGETAALLCWLAVRPGREYRSRVVRVQTVLTVALERGVLDPTGTTARCAAAVGLGEPTTASIDDDLLNAAAFIDDELWCAITADELDLTELRFEQRRDNRAVPVTLLVGGIGDPLHDVRVPRLLDAVVRYRRCSGVVLCALRRSAITGGHRTFDAADDWRLVFVSDQPIAYTPSRSHDLVDSVVSVDGDLLGRFSAAGTSLDAIFHSGGG